MRRLFVMLVVLLILLSTSAKPEEDQLTEEELKYLKPEDIEKERSNHATENRKLLRYFGLPEKDFPPATVSDVVAIFEDHLESFLSSEWPEWLTACQEVESAAGISLTKNQLAYRTATLKAGGTVPEMLMQVISKAKGQ